MRVMKTIVWATEALKEELISNGTVEGTEILWQKAATGEINDLKADAYIDLLFDNSRERIQFLRKFLPGTVIINSVTDTLKDTDLSFIRINGWPTFLRSSLIEASGEGEDQKKKAEQVFRQFNKQIEWLPDAPGFITPRVVSMIINEAFIALEEGVSSVEEIDTAMKLGTNYPFGPFQWAQEIGLQRIVTLLNRLSETQTRYAPSKELVQQTNSK
jgi:3-hydroxybutyryl-CoA dehydrogenase